MVEHKKGKCFKICNSTSIALPTLQRFILHLFYLLYPESDKRGIVDQAGWHNSEQVQVPEGIHLIFLPPAYSPELQPAERLWTLTNEPIANRSFKSLDELQEVLMYRCRQLLKRPEFIQGLTRASWVG